MEKYKLYIHVFPNEKVYIGITSQDVNERWRHGEGYKNQFVYKAILKYGWENIIHKVLFSGMTKKQAEKKEIELIIAYKSNDPNYGYNVANGGNCYGTHSEETKRKIAESNRRRCCKPETREKIRQANLGKTMTAEQRAKISNTLKGRVFTQEHKDKIKASLIGREISLETRLKIKEKRMGQKFKCNDPEKRGKLISDAMKERNKKKPEIMENMRNASIKKCSKPVLQQTPNGEDVALWASAAEIERMLGINHVQISRACYQEGKVVAGYLWRFV